MTGPTAYSHPAIAAPATTHTVVSPVIGTFNPSTISLKKNGTCTLSTLPPISNPRAPTTRTLVENAFFGHMFTASFLMIVQSVFACVFSETALEVVSVSMVLEVLLMVVVGAAEDGGGTCPGRVEENGRDDRSKWASGLTR